MSDCQQDSPFHNKCYLFLEFPSKYSNIYLYSFLNDNIWCHTVLLWFIYWHFNECSISIELMSFFLIDAYYIIEWLYRNLPYLFPINGNLNCSQLFAITNNAMKTLFIHYFNSCKYTFRINFQKENFWTKCHIYLQCL